MGTLLIFIYYHNYDTCLQIRLTDKACGFRRQYAFAFHMDLCIPGFTADSKADEHPKRRANLKAHLEAGLPFPMGRWAHSTGKAMECRQGNVCNMRYLM